MATFLAGELPDADAFNVALGRMGCRLSRVAAQALPDAAVTAVSWDTENEDTSGLWSAGTTITIPATGAGLWAISALVTVVASPPAGLGFVSVQINGGNRSLAGITFALGAPSLVVPLSATNTITVSAYADGAAATTMTAEIAVYRLGP